MRVDPQFSSAAGASADLSFAARERRAQRELFALCGVVLAAVATVAVSLGHPDGGLAASGVSASPAPQAAPSVESRAIERPAELARTPAASAPLIPTPHSDDAPPAALVAQRDPRTQAEYAARLRELDARAELLAELDAALAADRPAAQSFAALQVAYERLGVEAAPHFLRAARDLTHATPNAESVGRASITWLAKRAESEPVARQVLAELAQSFELAATLRAAAGVALVQHAPTAELSGLENRLLRDRDAHVAACVESALVARRATPSGEVLALEPLNHE